MSTFRIQEFAKLAGVTVRALHHYDRLGLLSPPHRSAAGYRLYSHDDLGRLERILVLRYLGLPLREIAALLQSSETGAAESLPATLARQQSVLRERRDGLNRVLRAIEHAQASASNSAEPDWLLYQSILKELHMQETQSWTDKYYTPEALATLQTRRSAWTPELQAENTANWTALLAEVQSAIDANTSPASEEAIALATRWQALADSFTLGDPELNKALGRLYSDRANWPQDPLADKLRATSPSPEQTAYINAAFYARSLRQIHSWTDTYYSPEALVTLRARRSATTPELQAATDAQWKALYADVQSAIDHAIAPTSDVGHSLAVRWKSLGDDFTQGNPHVAEGLQRLLADRDNWPQTPAANLLRASLPTPEHLAFIGEAFKTLSSN
jgi:DNA-binding transcriptional MerR regulator